MAESKELKHAGIGVDLNMNGLEDLRKASSMVDDLKAAFKDFDHVTEQFRNSFSGFGGKSSREFNQIQDSIKGTIEGMGYFNKATTRTTDAIHQQNSEMRRMKDSVKAASDEMQRMPKHVLTEINQSTDNITKSTNKGSDAIKNYSNHVDKAHQRMKRLHDIIFGSFVGTAVSNGLQTMASGIEGVVKSGYELAEGGEQIRAQWENIGLSKKQAKGMTDEIGVIRGQSNIAGTAIDAMQKKFYALTNSDSQAKKFTNEISAFGSAAGKSGQQIQQIAMGVAKLGGSKNVSAGFFQRSIGQLPAFQKAIISASGMTTKAFNDQLKNSKITGAKLQQYMTTAAKMSSKEWAAFGKTTKGQLASIVGTWQNVKSAFAAPLTEGVAKALESVDGKKGGLGDVKKQLQGIAKALGAKVGNYLGDAIKFLVKNRKPLTEIAKSVFSIGKNLAVGAWKPISAIIRSIGGNSGKASKGIRGIANGIKNVAEQKNAIRGIGSAMVAAFAGKKLLEMTLGMFNLRKRILEFTGATRIMDAAIKAAPWAIWITAIVGVIAILTKLYKHDKKFRTFVNGIVKEARKLAKDVTKQFGNLWKDAQRIFKTGFKVIERVTNTWIDILTGNWKNLRKDISRVGESLWKLLKNIFKSGLDWINDLTGGRLNDTIKLFSNAWHDIGKGWKSFWNGISDWFGDLWKGIVKHVQNGINDVIKVLNSGIGGIDSVIHMFGGKSNAIGKIGYVHFASGTGMLSNQRQEITRPTLAMLNDGHDSPETGNREMLIHPNGMSELIKGTNVKRLLEPGAEVLNASETKFALSLNGIQHFAKGTGLLSSIWNGAKSVGSSVVGGVEKGIGAIGNVAGGVLKATEKVFKTVKKIIGHPIKYLTGMLTKPKGSGEVLSDFAGGFYNKMKSQASDWWKSLWGMVDLDGSAGYGSGSRGDFVREAIKLGKAASGYSEVAGKRLGPNYYDCSGLVYEALKHIGITLPGSTTGPEQAASHHISWGSGKPGDLAFWNGHVGVVTSTSGNGRMYNAENPSDGIKFAPIKGFMSGFRGLFRVPGLTDGDGKGKNEKKSAGSGMQSLIKKQVGGGFFKFMDKLASMFGDNAGGSYGNPAGDSVSRWKPYVIKALKANGFSASASQVAAWMRVIQRESNGNPKAVNHWDSNAKAGHPSEGLVQTIGPTFNAYKFKGHGNIFNGYDDLLAGINYMKHIYGKGASAFARVSGPEGYAKGGRIQKNQLAKVNEDGWELFKPDTGGLMIPHEASEKIINGKKTATIDARTNVTIQGGEDMSDSTLNKLYEVLNKANDEKIAKFHQQLGFNDDGGITV
ncbi:hypothetical protein YK48G_03900 [Lentilactobacillus fungorum]|uniref:NlpC/P60 domain-containing protein n=1 Tax=Lentilactobacillus fungorum TaxID=2201250 RepID=A0ABQ3VVQ7_9LACO|nr:NlpC/P60 family protein [Lentilactobacillus fungorum]GHP12965.1 hypothetical protein YK48G_03900 [Lentilactobacillus fungorum]